MACFLGCFGFSKKRKRPKSGTSRILFGDQGHGSYEPLHHQPDLTTQTLENYPIPSDSKFRDEHNDRLSSKVKKKVSFNLNVRAYEPIDKEQSFSDEEPEKATISTLESEHNSAELTTGPFPSNHRYQGFRDSYDEDDDDIELEQNDIDDEFYDTDDDEQEDNDESNDYDYDYDYDYYNNHRPRTSWKEYSEPIYDSKDESGKRVDFAKPEEMKKTEQVLNVRYRSQYVHSVLNPVENLTQWKEVKARAAPKTKKQKENIVTKEEQIPLDHSKPLIQGFALDSSLSNWLNSSNTETISILSLKKNECL